jgi:hypothetical protein
LPNGLFSNQKSNFLQISVGLAMEDVGIFYGDSVYFMAIWYNLKRLGIFCSNLEYFYPFWYDVPRKIWQP